MFALDWAAIAGAGAFTAGIVVGAILTIRLTRLIWDSAVRARSDTEREDEAPRPPDM